MADVKKCLVKTDPIHRIVVSQETTAQRKFQQHFFNAQFLLKMRGDAFDETLNFTLGVASCLRFHLLPFYTFFPFHS